MKKLILPAIVCMVMVSIAIADFPGSPIGGGGGSGAATTDAGDLSSGTLPSARIGDNSVTNAKLLDNTVASSKIADGTIVNADVSGSAAIDATKIADGTVTSAEFQYLGDVTSAIQAQLDLLAPLVSPSFTTPTLGVASATSLDTGFGANELYDMDQHVLTTSDVVFNTVTAEIISPCTATDNDCFLEAVNTGALTDAYLKAGRLWFDNTLQAMKVRNNDNSATLEVFTSGAAHTLNFATTGTLTGGIMILDNVVSPTAAQCYGSWNTITTAGTVTLPAAAAGMSTCIATEGALEITLDLDGSDTFVLAGVTMDAGEAIINTTAEAAGDYICVIATSAVKWRVAGKQGTWTQATP